MAKAASLLALLSLTAALPWAAVLAGEPETPPPGLGVLSIVNDDVPPQPPRPCVSTDPLQTFACVRFEVDCPSAGEPLGGDLALGAPLAAPRGTLVFHGGGPGMNFWSGSNPAAQEFVTELRQAGYLVLQLRWDAPWSLPPEGVEAGHLGTTCRGLTAIQWIHDHLHAPLHPDLPAGSEAGQCGFCVVGWSHGSVLLSYGLAFHGLDSIVDAVVLESGPARVDQTRMCMVDLTPQERHGTDWSFGFRDGNGPCFRRDTSYVPKWDADSILTGGHDFAHPQTRVEFVFGTQDNGPGPEGGARYAQRLFEEGQPLLRVQVVPGAPHNLMATPDGVEAMRRAVLGGA